jgi:hypothetical protein
MSREKQLTAMLVPFYLGEKADSEGQKIQEMWAWDFIVISEIEDTFFSLNNKRAYFVIVSCFFATYF